jgi:hypothetical protein
VDFDVLAAWIIHAWLFVALMAVVPFASRAITLQFQLGGGQTFNTAGSNVITIAGLRIIASFQYALAPSLPNCIMRVFGMTLDQMNKLTVAGLYIYGKNVPNANSVAISAGIVNGQMATIFQGGIIEAYPDGEQPNMGFFIRAAFNTALRFTKVTPTSFQGSVPAATVMQSIASKGGITFENNGVGGVLSNPYFAGPPRDQMTAAAKAAGAYLFFDPIANKAAVWGKPGGSRSKSNIVVSAATGMIGYPKFESGSIRVRTLYDPSLQFSPGQPFEVQSQFAAACGSWVPSDVTIDISSQMPKGPWEISVKGYPASFPAAPGAPASLPPQDGVS